MADILTNHSHHKCLQLGLSDMTDSEFGYFIINNCKKLSSRYSVLQNSRDHFAMSQGPVPFLYCDLHERAALAVIICIEKDSSKRQTDLT